MYKSFYGFSAKPFQLKPDPHFYYASKGHKRAMAYLDYGLSQGEGFIVITGEVGAGKTTLMRNLFAKLPPSKIHAAQIVTTHVDSEDILRMVSVGFGLPFRQISKSEMLTNLEQFFRYCTTQGKRALLVVDEAQNLTPRAVEELRMLSNFQTNDSSLLQTFLLGQPELRKILLSDDMQQLRQRVIAAYHLGPLDAEETRAYIEHRLQTVGWKGDPAFSNDAFARIHEFTGGIPRRINTFCDRLLLMGFLEELHSFSSAEVAKVISDIQEEFSLPPGATAPGVSGSTLTGTMDNLHDMAMHSYSNSEEADSAAALEEKFSRMERSVTSVLDTVKKLLLSSKKQ